MIIIIIIIIVDFAVSAGHRVKSKESKREIDTKSLLENKKSMEHESDGDTKYKWSTWYNPQRISKGTGRYGNNPDLLRSASILKRVQKTWGDLLSL